MSRKGHRCATVAAFLLVAVALTGACGTSAPEGATPGPTFTAATLATPTSERIAGPPTAAPPPSPEIDFPLALGNTWVFQLTRYEGVTTGEIITTTSVVTETVVEVNNPLSFLVAQVRREESAEMPVGEVPPSWQGISLRTATSGDYWLVLSGNRLYRQEGNLDLSSLSTALLEFVFPLQLGNKWYQSDEKAKLNPTYGDDWMLRKVTLAGAVAVPAGEFDDCFFLEEAWAGTAFETWFCPGVGVVDRKSDHHGTPGGFREVLIRFQVTPTP